MDRKEFLSLMGLGAAGIVIPVMGCSKDESNACSPNTGVNTNLDLTTATYKPLTIDGGSVTLQDFNILVLFKGGKYYAVQSVCPHECGSLIFTNNKINCTKHTNTFSNTGVSDGQTTSASLKTYTCTLNGTTLNVKG